MNSKKLGPPYVVTVDGPAASGKSSVSRELALKLGWKWVSTGAFYRGLAYVAQARGVQVSDEAGLKKLAESSEWEVRLHPLKTQVFLSGTDVTDEIYSEDMGTLASQISSYQSVRKSLLKGQRDCAVNTVGLIAEGRDCGTVVFPNAGLKIFLTAESESRAERRAREEGKSAAETLRAQQKRDQQDTRRTAAPLQVPEDGQVIDTSHLSLKEVVTQVEGLIRERFRL